jgi:predicted GNAT family acetyltransferase
MTNDPTPSGDVTDNRAESRYELTVDRDTAIAAYDLDGDVIAFTHTAVPSRLEGRGIASRLIAGALADVRARHLRVRPLCTFVAAYFDRHPDQSDLLA